VGKEKQEQKVLYLWLVVFSSVIGLKKELWVEKGINLPKEFRDKPNNQIQCPRYWNQSNSHQSSLSQKKIGI